MPDFDFHLDSPIARGMCEFFRLLEVRLELDRPLTIFLAGGMAVHLYTAKRVTTDIDAEFSARVVVPSDLCVQVNLPDGSTEDIYFDSNFSTTLGLIPGCSRVACSMASLNSLSFTARPLSLWRWLPPRRV